MGREENVLIFQDTERLSKTNGKLNADLKASASGQKLILETDALEKPNLNIYDEPAKVIVSKKRTFEAAKAYRDNKVAVHNFASASNPGGGVVRGSTAQEECLCRCSYLYFCLNSPDMWDGFYTPHKQARIHYIKIAFVKDYPFAKYVARELVKPAGYVTNEEAVNFDTKYQGQDVKTAVYNSEYKNTPTTFEFTKTDITSGAELTGATLTVLDKDGNVVDTWTFDAKEAHVIKRLVVGEIYTLREEFAPYGYLNATDIQFTVEDTGKVQHVEMKDEVPTGSIVINKDGEFVTDTTLMKGYWYDFIFNFFKDSLAGVTFDVYAKEDIVSADGLDTVYHKAGDKVATIVTNDKGIARIDDLPLGKYYLVETKTIDGFVLDDTPIEADLSYIDQNTKVVFAGMDVTNERQKVQITVTKTDSETKEALEGAVFGLFAKEDIVNKDGKVIVKADTQIERTVTGKDGKVLDTLTTDKNGHAESKELPICTYNEDGSFKEDIHYTVVETKAADGYILDETAHDVTLRYDDNAPDVVVTTLKLVNVPTEPKLPQTGDNANPLLYLGIGALALITGVGVGLRGRKKKNKQ